LPLHGVPVAEQRIPGAWIVRVEGRHRAELPDSVGDVARTDVKPRWYRDRIDASTRTTRATRTMHIVVAAWLFVTFTMALTLSNAWAGLAFFAVVGLLPVVLLVAAGARARRSRARWGSVPEEDVHAADHRDAKSDQ
jgi:Flp pilus assembly protein TadB